MNTVLEEIVLALGADEAEGLADLLSIQWHDKGWRDLSEYLYTELDRVRNDA